MRGFKILIMCFVAISFLTACTDYDKMANKVVEDNKRKEDVMVKVGQSQSATESIKEVVTDILVDNDLGRIGKSERLSPYKNLQSDLSVLLPTITDEIEYFIEQENEFQRTLFEDEKVDSLVELSYNTYTKDNLRHHVFMDDKTGLVEQMFFIRLTNGELYGFSLFWLGGVYIGSESNNS